MNCLRIRPGTVRKPGAILRKCSAQAAWSMLGGRRYWTIAVIMAASRLLSRWYGVSGRLGQGLSALPAHRAAPMIWAIRGGGDHGQPTGPHHRRAARTVAGRGVG